MKSTILALLILLSLNSYAQNIAITKSNIFKDSKKNSSLSFSLEDENGGLVTIRQFNAGLMKRIKGYYIQHFDANLKLIKEKEYEVDNSYIKNAFIKDNKLHLIEYHLNKKSKKVSFKDVSADLNKLIFSKKTFLSLSRDNQQQYFGILLPFVFISNYSQQDGNHSGEVIMSKNNNFFVINFDINNKNKETHRVFVYNNSFEKIYDQQIQKDIKDKLFKYNSIEIDDEDASVYFLGKSFENNSKRTKKNKRANYHFELFKVTKSGQQNVSFKHSTRFISSLKLKKFKDRIACVGFYGKMDDHRMNGVCLFNLNAETLAMEKKKFNPFTAEFLTDKYGNREGKKTRSKKKGIINVDFKSVYMLDNGDIILNAEEFYITTTTSVDANGNSTTRTTFHFDDIISARMSKDGDLKWARNINKRQTGFYNSSYTSIPVGENSYIFINCSDKIRKRSADRISFKQTNAKRSNLYMIKIDKNGIFDYKKLIDDKDSKVYYKVNNGNVNLQNQTVILTGKRTKKTRILKLKI